MIPNLEEIHLLPAPADEQSSLLAYQAGDVDSMDVGWSVYKTLVGTEWEGQIHQEPGSAWYSLVIRENKAPTDDLNIRKALLLALDYETISAAILAPELPGPQWQLLDFMHDCRTDKQGWWYDPEEAKRLIAESKYADTIGDLPINIRYSPNDTLPAKLIQVYQQYWQEVGFKINLFQLSVVDPDLMATMHMARISDGYSDYDPVQFLNAYLRSDGPVMSGYEGAQISEAVCPACVEQRAAYKHIDDMIDELVAMPKDDPGLCDMVNKVEQAALDDFHYVPLFVTSRFFLFQPWVQDLVLGPNIVNQHFVGMESDTWIADH